MSDVMRAIRIEKVTLNFGAGKDQALLEKGAKLLKHITGVEPVKTKTKKRIPGWGLRPGLPIGCKITLRKDFQDLLTRLIKAKDSILTDRQFDDNGNVAFGIHEYIDIPGTEYNPDVGILGLQVCVSLTRPGYRIKSRKLRKTKLPARHRISKKDAIEFMQKEFSVQIGE